MKDLARKFQQYVLEPPEIVVGLAIAWLITLFVYLHLS